MKRRRRSEAKSVRQMDDRSFISPIENKSERKPKSIELRIPHDIVNEQVIIAAALADVDVCDRLLRRIPTDSFFGAGHPASWEALADLRRRGLTYDPATIRQLTGGAVDTDYLDSLVSDRPIVPPNLDHHISALEWDRVRVEAARGPIGSLLEAIREPNADPERVRSLALQVSKSFDKADLRYLRDPNELVRTQVSEIWKRKQGLSCYSYGIEGLDTFDDGSPRMIPGTAPKQVTVITGLSGGGKTTFTAHVALGLANAGRKVLFGAWEQGSGLTLELIATISLGLSRTDLTVGNVEEYTIQELETEMLRLSEFIRFFEIPFGRKQGEKQLNERALDTIHAYIAESGCDVFIADLWRRALRQFDPDEEEFALYRQQAIAQETGTHHILIHQQRLKDIESRGDKQPTREGLKGSGAWVEMPDTILGIHRPALWKAIPDDTIQAFVLKQRHGRWPLAVEFDWVPEYGLIRNGREVEYMQPGSEGEVDSFLSEATQKTKRRKR